MIREYKKLTKIAKREFQITWIFRILLILAMLTSIMTSNWMNAFTSMLTFLLTFISTFAEKKIKIEIIPEINIIALVFLFAANFLGEMNDFYYKFWWWDIMLHTLSGLFLGFLGFIVVYMLNGNKNVGVNLSPIFIAIFSFTFALATGALWEIFEFTMDSLFGLDMQKSGLVDTMWDLIIDSLGAVAAAISCYLYLVIGRTSKMINIVRKFIKRNNREEVYKN